LALHMLALRTALKLSAAHSAQARSLLGLPSAETYVPGSQSLYATQLPFASRNVPPVHGSGDPVACGSSSPRQPNTQTPATRLAASFHATVERRAGVTGTVHRAAWRVDIKCSPSESPDKHARASPRVASLLSLALNLRAVQRGPLLTPRAFAAAAACSCRSHAVRRETSCVPQRQALGLRCRGEGHLLVDGCEEPSSSTTPAGSSRVSASACRPVQPRAFIAAHGRQFPLR
jgi:hypothetical protein